jgi:SAM-dependent methyltransferase
LYPEPEHGDRRSVDWADAADGYLGYFDSDADRLRRDLLDPIILDLLRPAGKRILDLGCGEGYFSRILKSRQAQRVVGVDVAEELIEKARAQDPDGDYLVFDIDRDEIGEPQGFDSVIANMVLMDVHDLDLVLRKIHAWLRPEGQLIASFTNPYYGYPVGIWRDVGASLGDRAGRSLLITSYFEERSVEKKLGALRVPHTHRPFSTYVNLAHENGLNLRRFLEPRISEQMGQRYSKLRLAQQLEHVPLFFVLEFRRTE